MQMQMSEAKMKGSNRYMETVEADRKGRDESEGQDKVMRTFFYTNNLRKRSWLEEFCCSLRREY